MIELLLMIKNRIASLCEGDNLNPKKNEDYIMSFPNPKDLFERAYFQYLCQLKTTRVFLKIIIAFGNYISFFIILLCLIVPTRVFKKMYKIETVHSNAVCGFKNSLEDRIPLELLEEYESIYFLSRIRVVLTKKEKRFILRLWKRYPLSGIFVLKNLIKIGIYRFLLETNENKVKAIISSCEYSYTSSIITQYCRECGIKHINIMHGEIISELKKAFFEFDQFYVWDDYYKRSCPERLRVNEEQFVIGTPPCLKFKKSSVDAPIKYKYYFQNHSIEQAKIVRRILESTGEDYVVRPHPIYTGAELLSKVFSMANIEPLEISIDNSIVETEYVIAWDSTVLFQAYKNGIKPVIDDISNPDRYRYMAESGYIMVEKAMKLSDVINVKETKQ